jgi:ubiquinone/menaquinone biosynthesis C-methylase UbiE
VAFYDTQLRSAKGPILEAMCGSGKLLIPLLKKGLLLDGVDNSSHMLESCQRRCKAQNLNVSLYNQSLQNLTLPQK